MTIITLSFILAALVMVVFAVWGLRRRRNAQDGHALHARAALRSCNILLALIAAVQQHRGMSTAWLAGDQTFENRLTAKRAEIAPLVAQLQQVAIAENGYSYPCFTPNDAMLWRHRWNMLERELATYTVEKSIAAHSNLVAMLLNWLDALGEARIELPLGSALPEGAVRNFAHRLPHLTECLGQARATGSGVAAQGSCTAVARVRLMFLVSRAESLIDQACAVDVRGGAAVQRVKGLAGMIRTRMLSSQKVEVGAAQYFAEASAAIDAVFHWVDDCGRDLEIRIERLASGQASLHH